MPSFGSTTLPHVLSVERKRVSSLTERPIVGDETGYHDYLGGQGRSVIVRGEIRGNDWETTRQALESLADGVTRTLDDGTGLSTFSAIMLSPRFTRQVENAQIVPYELTFMEK